MKNLTTNKKHCNTKLGRLLARLIGEENGIAMEYVIIMVLVAAVCALIFGVLGKSIHKEAQVAVDATVHKTETAESDQSTAENDADSGKGSAVLNQNNIIGTEAPAAKVQ